MRFAVATQLLREARPVVRAVRSQQPERGDLIRVGLRRGDSPLDPAHSGRTASAAAASSELGSFVIATVYAPLVRASWR